MVNPAENDPAHEVYLRHLNRTQRDGKPRSQQRAASSAMRELRRTHPERATALDQASRRVLFTQRSYPGTTYCWASLDGKELGDPWPAYRWPADVLRIELARQGIA